MSTKQQRLIIMAALAFGSLCGCEKADSPPQPTARPEPAQAEKPVEVPAEEQAPAESLTSRFSSALSEIRKRGGGAATDVSDMAGGVYDDVTSTGSEATEKTVSWITDMYNSAKETGETSTTSARDWVMDDFKKGGSWEYQVVTASNDPAEQQAQLNKLGRSRWECYSVLHQESETTFYLKRNASSVIRNLPARELFRLLPLLGGGGGE